MTKKKMSKYRQRGYECEACLGIEMIYGADPEPTECWICKSDKIKLKWDNLVVDSTEVTPTPKEQA